MAEVLQGAAERVVMPRFRRLAETDIEEKSPGELVTTADREAEEMIANGLAAINSSARFVGEEACAREPSALRNLDKGEVWIVDPIDGTGNYASGRSPFALMAALVQDGETIAACILDPVGGILTLAERGSGAWINGQRLSARRAVKHLNSCTGIVSNFQRPRTMEAQVAGLTGLAAQVLPSQRCAGAEYPLVASGVRDFALYWRTLVWDHAPGVLILEEAGGKAARLDGTPYRPSDPNGAILLSHSPEIWAQVAAKLSNQPQPL